MYTKHLSRLHSKAYICRVKIEGCSKLEWLCLSPRALKYLILDQQNVCSKEEKLYEFKRCEASANSGNDEQSPFGSGFFSAIICFLTKSKESSSHRFRFMTYEFSLRPKMLFFILFFYRLALDLFSCPVCLSSMRSPLKQDCHVLIWTTLSITKNKRTRFQKICIIFLLFFSLFFLCGDYPSLTKLSWNPLVFVALLYISVFKSLYFCRQKMNRGYESSLCL